MFLPFQSKNQVKATHKYLIEIRQIFTYLEVFTRYSDFYLILHK